VNKPNHVESISQLDGLRERLADLVESIDFKALPGPYLGMAKKVKKDIDRLEEQTRASLTTIKQGFDLLEGLSLDYPKTVSGGKKNHAT
jgi:hypothetical protein